MGPLRRTAWALSPLLALCACELPYLGHDGTVIFPEKGAHGATIVTENGIEFRDRDDVPSRIVRHSTSEPWRAPVGFILPHSGRFTETSRPTVVATNGLAFALRPSDTRVPSWGGEVLVRVDIIAPAAAGTAREGERIVLVLDGVGRDTLLLGDVALGQLGAYDHFGVVDATDAKLVVPMLPGNHKSLASAAIEKREREGTHRSRDLTGALKMAGSMLGPTGARRLLVLTDGHGTLDDTSMMAVGALGDSGVIVSAVPSDIGVDSMYVASMATSGGVAQTADGVPARAAMVKRAIPAAGLVTFTDTKVSFAGNPAPSHVLESSGGGVLWHPNSGDLWLGEVRAGEARTEVLRVTIPPYLPGHKFTFEVTAHANDATTGEERVFYAEVPCTYDDDIERIANSRNGDVIAYASALATLKRLDAAFVGEDVRRAGGVKAVARLHAQSMTLLARDTGDHAIAEQAEILNSLLATLGP
jgi:hypothetical protein